MLRGYRANISFPDTSRFYFHFIIADFAQAIVLNLGHSNEQAILFPSTSVANQCIDFMIEQSISRTPENITDQRPTLHREKNVRLIDLVYQSERYANRNGRNGLTAISAVLFPEEHFGSAKTFWQHSGDGISSRSAEFHHRAFEEGYLTCRSSCERQETKQSLVPKGPRRYQKAKSVEQADADTNGIILGKPTLTNFKSRDTLSYTQFLEERFGRNLEIALAANAKLAVRRRITGSLTADVDLQEALHISRDSVSSREVSGVSENDVFLFPCGMSSIFNLHRIMLAARGPLKSVSYGYDMSVITIVCFSLMLARFPYIDTLKILQKWGPGCLFYGHGSSSDLDDLERRCEDGEKYLALFCEFPGNPLLKCPDLQRIRSLADRYNFAVVVDETVGNFMNVHVLPFADVVVTSLTKVFSGDSNVMGGW